MAGGTREAIDGLRSLVAEDEVDLVAVGKAYQRLAIALEAATSEHGPPSVRFEAVVKALDLTTKKSTLRAFVDA